ncbi:MAG: membrane fusion protein MtrC [Methylococcaceae bacterium]|nr:membrane fusion protein MtrC [Methylococcaceae bacterium]
MSKPKRRFGLPILILLLCRVSLLDAAPGTQSNPPAALDRPGDELTLNRIKLTAKARERLGIKVEPLVEQRVVRYRMYSGEMILPAATGIGASNAESEGQSVIGVVALMNPSERVRVAEAQIDADGRVDAALVRLNAAGIVLRRAEKLVADKAGSQKAVDAARADYALAAADLDTMKNRRKLLGPPLLVTGTRNKLWVRVQVFVNDLDGLDLTASARLGRLGASLNSGDREARPIPSAPRFADFDSSIVDLFYAVDNPDGRFRPNQRVGVEIPLQEKSNGLLVPVAALLHDVHGNTWVYAQIDESTYARKRVEIRSGQGGMAVLAEGLSSADLVVTDGAAELFGSEFGVGK